MKESTSQTKNFINRSLKSWKKFHVFTIALYLYSTLKFGSCKYLAKSSGNCETHFVDTKFYPALVIYRFRNNKKFCHSCFRHSRFGGTYVVQNLKSINDENELIYHKPLNRLDALNFDADKDRKRTPKNRLPVHNINYSRKTIFSIRLFLKDFCIEFLKAGYNKLMHHTAMRLERAKSAMHDESYYLWTMRFFMEFNRLYKFDIKLVR